MRCSTEIPVPTAYGADMPDGLSEITNAGAHRRTADSGQRIGRLAGSGKRPATVDTKMTYTTTTNEWPPTQNIHNTIRNESITETTRLTGK